MMEIIPYGSHALLINFEKKIDSTIHSLVMSYFHLLEKFPEVSYQIPAYCSITVGYDPAAINYHQLKEKIENTKVDMNRSKAGSKVIEIPVCYAHDFAPDLEEVSKRLKLNPEEIIRMHTAEIYDVYMMGFLPGFPYLGKLPKALECARKSTPRKQVKAGSVGLAGSQTGIYPSVAPGGWQLIGQTPIHLFNPSKNNSFLIKVGNRIKFKSIDADEFEKIAHNGK